MKNRYIKIGAFLVFIGMMGYIAYNYYYVPVYVEAPSLIQEFSYDRDASDILTLFEADRYWLTETPGYDINFNLTHKAISKNPSSFGKLHIKVLRLEDQFVGFVAYYMKNFFEGYVLFLATKPEFRGKGYGVQMMQYALDELKKMGAKTVRLVTRVSNHAAQAVYTKIGFKKIYEEPEAGLVYFAKDLP